jgi:transposase
MVSSCAGCQARDRKIERLQQEVRRLRRELDEVRRQQHRQTAPFRRRHTKKRARKPGRRHGHRPAHRPTPPPERVDRVIAVPCGHCPDCRVELVDPGTVVQYQTDLPPITPIVTQFNIETQSFQI